MTGARRHTRQRLAIAFACLIATLSAVEIASAAEITSAQYSLPTERYQHGILGDTVEYGGLEIQLSDGQHLALTLPKTHVFEDLTPRLWDVDLDGNPEIVVIETSLTKGARLSIYDENGFVTATPYIGRSHRWLAPIGALDMDRDGYVEIAYIDRPHLAKTLKVWRFKNGKLVHVADQTGLTNHRIGWAHIPGGIRDCDGQLEWITANSDWSRIIATSLKNDKPISRDLGKYIDLTGINDALSCP